MSNGEDGFNITFGERSSREEDDDSPGEVQDGTPVEDDPPGEITPAGGGDGPDLGPPSDVGSDSGGTSSTAEEVTPVSEPGPSPGTGSGVSSGVSSEPETGDLPPPEPSPAGDSASSWTPASRTQTEEGVTVTPSIWFPPAQVEVPLSPEEQLFEDPEVLGRHQIGSEAPTPDNY